LVHVEVVEPLSFGLSDWLREIPKHKRPEREPFRDKGLSMRV